jgi:lactoylglutathione lyase
MAIAGIGHLALAVSDMKRSAEFYTGILGFRKVHELLDDNGRPWIVYFKVGAGQFMELFHPRPGVTIDVAARGAFSHVCFLVDDIRSTAADIERRGGTLDQPIKVGKNGCFQCWVKDPDGNRIELMQATEGTPLAAHMG